jgi:hypothetical protein
MNMALPRNIFLTFDVEDFINDRSIKALNCILEMLKKNKLKALFFITGHMAEKLSEHEETLGLLREHQIGYHSSSHSVRPTILEYTDVENYDEALLESERRETSHINPLTGEMEGKGGIHILRELFANNRIEAFRAPDYCWTPPHLEALNKLGIHYDFSTKIVHEPASYKGITFYPYPICHYWKGRSSYLRLARCVAVRKTTVLNFHDWDFVNSKAWNYFYRNGNPEELFKVPPRSYESMENMFTSFESFLKRVKALETTGIVRVTPKLENPGKRLEINRVPVEQMCREIARWFKGDYFYQTRYLHQHFKTFFEAYPA